MNYETAAIGGDGQHLGLEGPAPKKRSRWIAIVAVLLLSLIHI